MYMMTCQLKVNDEKLKIVNIDGREVGSVNELYVIDAVALLLKSLSKSQVQMLADVTHFSILPAMVIPSTQGEFK